MFSQRGIHTLIGVLFVGVLVCSGQDYDDDNYGNQGGGSNQGDPDNFSGGYNNDDGYSGNAPNYQQNADQEATNNNPNNYSVQGGADPDNDYEGDDNSAAAAASSLVPSIARVKRSVLVAAAGEQPEVLSAIRERTLESASSEPKKRVKRHGKHYIGPVYTYVKTDKHANFKWGVKHKVGKKHHG